MEIRQEDSQYIASVKGKNCLILAHCDAYVSKRMVKYGEREPVSLVRHLNFESFQQLLTQHKNAQKYEQILSNCYQEVKDSFYSIKFDTFNGYGLFYEGKHKLCYNSKKKFRIPELRALIQRVPSFLEDQIKPVSVFAPTDLCSQMRIMVGPVRFVNHSCDPNCEYVVTEHKNMKCVGLQILKDIEPYTELNVYYGPNFFETGNSSCKCPYTQFHCSTPCTSRYEVSVQSHRISLKPETVMRFEDRRYRLNRSNGPKVKRKKIVQYEMREHYSDSSNEHSDQENCSDVETRNFFDSIEQNGLDSVSKSEIQINNKTLDHNVDETVADAVVSSPSIATEDFDQNRLLGVLASSPILKDAENQIMDLSLSQIDVLGNDSFDRSSSGDVDDSQQNVSSMSNFVLCANALIARHGTSDAEANNWFKLIRTAFPESDIPSFKALKRQYHVVKASEVSFIRISGLGKRWQLDFISELKQIVNSNVREIFQFSTTREENTDLKIGNPFNHLLQTLTVHLLLNSDGVDAFKCNPKSLWPVWLAIADLPPMKRCMYKNITLATLWYGKNKPDWNELFQVIFFVSKFSN